MVEIKENVLTGHRAKLLEHTTGRKEKSHPVYALDQLYLSLGSPGAELPPTRDIPQAGVLWYFPVYLIARSFCSWVTLCQSNLFHDQLSLTPLLEVASALMMFKCSTHIHHFEALAKVYLSNSLYLTCPLAHSRVRRTNNVKDTGKRKQRQSLGGNGSAAKEYPIKFNQSHLVQGTSFTNTFSCSSKFRKREKGLISSFSLRQTLHIEIPGESKKSCFLPAVSQMSWDLSAAVSGRRVPWSFMTSTNILRKIGEFGRWVRIGGLWLVSKLLKYPADYVNCQRTGNPIPILSLSENR